MDEIYVKLLNEGTEVYRPVPAKTIGESVYLIDGSVAYDAADETWEYPPGSRVQVTQRSKRPVRDVLTVVKRDFRRWV
jgi:hypothetical protein